MKVIKLIIILLVFFVLSACPSIKTLNRYQYAKFETSEDSHVIVSNFVTDVEKSGTKPTPILLQLSEKGQAKYIESLSTLCKKADCFYGGMNQNFPTSSLNDNIDRTIIAKRIFFSVQKMENDYKPANRISQLRMVVKNSADGINFVKWNRFTTEYGEADLGKIESKRTIGADVKVSPTFSGSLVGAGEAGISYQNESTEEFQLKKRYITLSGVFSTHEIALMQEGIVGIDLVGNFSIDLTLSFINSEKKEIFRVKKRKMDKDQIELVEASVKVPDLSTIQKLVEGNGLILNLEGDYVLRDVTSGGNTIIEGDDSVKFIKGKITGSPKSISILSKNGLRNLRTRYFIHLFGNPAQQLQIVLRKNKEVPLEFENYDEAKAVIDWMIDNKTTIVSGKQITIISEKTKTTKQKQGADQGSDSTSEALSVNLLENLRIKERGNTW